MEFPYWIGDSGVTVSSGIFAVIIATMLLELDGSQRNNPGRRVQAENAME